MTWDHGALFALIRRHLAVLPDAAPAPAPDAAAEREFQVQCRARLEHHGKVVAGAILVLTVLWWPIDLWVFRRLPAALHGQHLWRAAISLLCLGYLALPLPAALRRRPFWVLALVGCCGGVAMGYSAGTMGDLQRPYFHLLYPILLFSLLLPLPLWQRVLGTGLIAVGLFIGLLLAAPSQLASPFLSVALSMTGAVLLMSVGFGHLFFVLTRENFHQARQLHQHNERLEEHVSAQTAELRRLLAHVETAREDERVRISRELHDELGQELSALRYALAFTRQRYQREAGAIDANLAEMAGLLERTGSTVRQIVAGLRPRALDDLGLVAAAQWLAQRTSERAGLPCDLAVHGDDAGVGGEQASAAYRILQEALTNVARHAGATRAEVRLRITPAALELEVDDDGAGFRVEERGASGMGLLGMRERARALGGELRIRSAPGAGTQVAARLPLGGT